MKGYIRKQWNSVKVRASLDELGGDLSRWRRTCPGAYSWAQRNGLLPKLREQFAGEGPLLDMLRESTRPYVLFKEWRLEHPDLYFRAHRRRFLGVIWDTHHSSHRYLIKVSGKVKGEPGAFMSGDVEGEV